MTATRDFRAIFAGLLATSIWGGMYVVSKVVLEVIPPFGLITLRPVLGALVLLALAAGSVKQEPPQLRLLNSHRPMQGGGSRQEEARHGGYQFHKCSKSLNGSKKWSSERR